MSLLKAEMREIHGAGNKRFAIAASRFNCDFVDAMVKDARSTLMENGVEPENIKIVRVPGSAELPFACLKLAEKASYDVIIALGVVIAGETPHHMVIAHSTAQALQSISLKFGICVVNGIIVANTTEQAEARTVGKIQRGVEFAESALEMACNFPLELENANSVSDIINSNI